MDALLVVTSEGKVPSADLEREDVPNETLVGTGVSGEWSKGLPA